MIFISHASPPEDVEAARSVASALRDAGIEAWSFQDVGAIGPSENWVAALADRISKATAVILLISDAAIESHVVEKELEQAFDKKKPIYPLLLNVSVEQLRTRLAARKKGNWTFILGTAQLSQFSPTARAQLVNSLTSGRTGELVAFLRARGYQILGDPGSDVFLTIRNSDGFERLCWFFCPQRDLLLNDVQVFISRLKATKGAEAWIITNQAMAADARRAIRAKRSIRVASLVRFYGAVLGYEGSLNALIQSVQEEVTPYWVDLECEDENGAPFNAIEYADRFLKDAARPHLVLLGGFGTGKTWFCRYYAAQLARRHLANPDENRIPLLIPLGGWARAQSLEAHLTDVLINKRHIGLTNYETFEHLNSHGRLILLLDGFDDMEQRVERRVAEENYKQVISALVPRSKIVLTSRPPYFRESEVARDLRNTHGVSTASFRVFSDDQIQKALRKRLPDQWKAWWEQIKGTATLKTIASRPIMMQIIAEVLPDAVKNNHPSTATLYEIFIKQGWIHNGCRASDRETEVLGFLSSLALDMFSAQANNTIGREDLRARAEACFHSAQLTDLLQQLFVVDSQTGNYTFPHFSFMEFLVARSIAAELATGQGEWLFRSRLTEGVKQFLKEMADSNWANACSGLFTIALQAERSEQVTVGVEAMKAISGGNPLSVVLEALTRISDSPELSGDLLRELGVLEYIEAVGDVQNSGAQRFLVRLWASPSINSDQALPELRQIVETRDETMQKLALRVIGERAGDSEIAFLLASLEDDSRRYELRDSCLDSLEPLLTGRGGSNAGVRANVLQTLHRVIQRGEADISLRRRCILLMKYYDQLEEHKPIIKSILRDHDVHPVEIWATYLSVLKLTSSREIDEELGDIPITADDRFHQVLAATRTSIQQRVERNLHRHASGKAGSRS